MHRLPQAPADEREIRRLEALGLTRAAAIDAAAEYYGARRDEIEWLVGGASRL